MNLSERFEVAAKKWEQLAVRYEEMGLPEASAANLRGRAAGLREAQLLIAREEVPTP